MSEIIDVPVDAACGLQMMSDTGFQTAGTESAAKVQIERRVKLNSAKAPNL